MAEQFFMGIFSSAGSTGISLGQFFGCAVTALVLGVFMSKMYAYKTKCTKGFLSTLAILPLVVSMVIIMVNGSIGVGVAVMGAFSLVRFRSIPGSAKEIGAIFTAMGTGLTIGMGQIALAALFAIIACTFTLVLTLIKFGEKKATIRVLHVTIPENLNYTNVFDDVFATYTDHAELISAKTTSMGSLFKLSYEIELKNLSIEKDFMDELRTRNGNLEIIITKQELLTNGL